MNHALRAVTSLAVVSLAGVVACLPGKPVLDRSHSDDRARGTIGGVVQMAGGGQPLAGRGVHAVDPATGARYSATSSVTGGFSIQVPPGKYRLEVDLLEGERLVEEPGTIDIGPSDLDANIEVEVGLQPPSAPPDR